MPTPTEGGDTLNEQWEVKYSGWSAAQLKAEAERLWVVYQESRAVEAQLYVDAGEIEASSSEDVRMTSGNDPTKLYSIVVGEGSVVHRVSVNADTSPHIFQLRDEVEWLKARAKEKDAAK